MPSHKFAPPVRRIHLAVCTCPMPGRLRKLLIRTNRVVFLAAVIFSLLTAAGCKKSDGKVPVHGSVSFRGQPIDRASLTFFSEQGRPEGTAVEDGAYSTALAAGDYTVVILIGRDLPPGYKEGDPIPPPKVVLPDEYSSRLKSPLKASVNVGQSEPIDFSL